MMLTVKMSSPNVEIFLLFHNHISNACAFIYLQFILKVDEGLCDADGPSAKPPPAIQGGQKVGEDPFCLSLLLFAYMYDYFCQTSQLHRAKCLARLCVASSRCSRRSSSLTRSSDAASLVFPAGWNHRAAIDAPLGLALMSTKAFQPFSCLPDPMFSPSVYIEALLTGPRLHAALLLFLSFIYIFSESSKKWMWNLRRRCLRRL